MDKWNGTDPSLPMFSYIEEKSYYVYKVSISGSGFKAEMVVRGEMEF